MAIPVKATCSECLTMQYTKLEFGQAVLKCPSCGHSMQNLPEGELNEMELTFKAQRRNGIIAIISFAVAIVCFFLWAFNQDPSLYHYGKMERPPEDALMHVVVPGILIVSLLVSIVFGVLGSTKRYIVEF